MQQPTNPYHRTGRVVAGRSSIRLALVLTVAFGAALAVAVPQTALAHARYASSSPAPNQVLKAAPSTVTIHFEENVNPVGSDITVYDTKGKAVSSAPAQVDRADLKTMTVAMQGDGAETYLVTWHNVSADDGDPDTGAFTFVVSSDATPQPGATGTGTTTTTSATGGTPGWVVALIGVLGLLIGGGAGVLAGRRRA